MAVAHDAQTRLPTSGADNDAGTTSASFGGSHVASASAKGAICVVFANLGTDAISGVTYGGTAMTRVGTFAADTVEVGSVYLYFLGDLTGLGGTQTVTVTGSGIAKWATISTVTAATATTQSIGSGKVDTTTSTNPTVTFSLSAAGMVYGGVHGGAAAPTSYAAGTGETIQFGADYGTLSARSARSTSAASSGNYTFDFSFGTSDDWCITAMGVGEVTAAAQSLASPHRLAKQFPHVRL